jgi:galactonate dehydratase
MDCVEAVHSAIHGKAEVLIECHGRFDLPTALRIGKALEKFDIFWMEEPIIPDTIESLADLRSRINVPISFGERLYGAWSFRTLLEARAADYVQPDVSHAGGITELRKIAALAETHHVPFCPHNPSGPVANAATLQLAASQPNFCILEIMYSDVEWRKHVTNESLFYENGYMKISDKAGLGIELNEEECLKHPYVEHNLRHYTGALTDIRPAKTEFYF